MNNRINDLAEKALDAAVPETWTTLSHVQLVRFQEEFSQLLVRDCCAIIAQAVDQRVPASEYVSILKEVFGVK